jgi:hypothetical protein
MKKIYVLFLLVIIASCTSQNTRTNFNTIAENYVRLALTIGQYDADFVDAYYGPDSLKPSAQKDSVFPSDSLLIAVKNLQEQLQPFMDTLKQDSNRVRARWINNQLTAFSERIRSFSGKFSSFDDEAFHLFGVKPPHFSQEHFRSLAGELDSILPGTGPVSTRMQSLSKKFIIPKDKLDTVFNIAIAEARRRTLAKYALPTNESFKIEYVTNKPWGGYNWYKGNYQSLIQINVDLPILIDRAIDLACHEGYPGHHVYNMLLEKDLYHEKGWVEISLYPLFSPQSFIAEGSANYGIEMCFPGEQGLLFAKSRLLPAAGLDSSGADVYFKVLALKSKLNYARNEAARGIVNGTMNEAQALKWLTDYSLMNNESAEKFISFIKKMRSYVICYNYGQDLVKKYVESDNMDKKWDRFGWLLSNPVIPSDLENVSAGR